MEFVVVERNYPHPITEAQVEARLKEPQPCYDLRQVKHIMTVLARDGMRALCMYEAPDAASVRDACDEQGDAYVRIWTGTRMTKP